MILKLRTINQVVLVQSIFKILPPSILQDDLVGSKIKMLEFVNEFLCKKIKKFTIYLNLKKFNLAFQSFHKHTHHSFVSVGGVLYEYGIFISSE